MNDAQWQDYKGLLYALMQDGTIMQLTYVADIDQPVIPALFKAYTHISDDGMFIFHTIAYWDRGKNRLSTLEDMVLYPTAIEATTGRVDLDTIIPALKDKTVKFHVSVIGMMRDPDHPGKFVPKMQLTGER